MATVMLTGELWMRVPEVIRIELNGTLQDGVFAKDVILHVLGKLKSDVAVYKAIEFCGSYVDALGVAERMTVCNMAVEMGAKTAYMKPNRTVLDYIRSRTDREFILDETDSDFEYDAEYVFDLTDLGPQLACPSSVDNVNDLVEVGPVKVNQAFIGSCTGGRLEDLEAAHAVLKGRTIHPSVRLIVIPASSEVLVKAMEKGIAQGLMAAGASFASPGCGPCLGTHAGLLADGEVCITATNRNFPGRMGSAKANIYLGSPASVAAAAVTGEITDPRTFLQQGGDR
jgi:3-isopropylmalate/(R)-2-methylmalate dehydratase large subunit